MKYISLLFLLLLTACGGRAKLDAAKLESLLSSSRIDRVAVVIPFTRTNILTAAEAMRYALSFRETNLVAEADATKAQVATEVVLGSGTNELVRLSQFDNGLWRFGDYSFRLRTVP